MPPFIQIRVKSFTRDKASRVGLVASLEEEEKDFPPSLRSMYPEKNLCEDIED